MPQGILVLQENKEPAHEPFSQLASLLHSDSKPFTSARGSRSVWVMDLPPFVNLQVFTYSRGRDAHR